MWRDRAPLIVYEEIGNLVFKVLFRKCAWTSLDSPLTLLKTCGYRAMERSVDMDENRKVDVSNNEEKKDCGWSGREVLQVPG
jgi:hypothetical protein